MVLPPRRNVWRSTSGSFPVYCHRNAFRKVPKIATTFNWTTWRWLLPNPIVRTGELYLHLPQVSLCFFFTLTAYERMQLYTDGDISSCVCVADGEDPARGFCSKRGATSTSATVLGTGHTHTAWTVSCGLCMDAIWRCVMGAENSRRARAGLKH